MAKTSEKAVNLALQGGGAHGALTWGVLDALLEDGRIRIEAISGTSAGAMNAVALAQGYATDGPDGARACLRRFWQAVADAAPAAVVSNSPLGAFLAAWGVGASPWPATALDWWSRFFSPYDLNPLNLNPLRDLVAGLIDFETVRGCQAIELYIAATNVRSGRARIFTRDELTADHVMASACLPFLFQAVKIDEALYWDGGFVGNPPLFPFFYHSKSRDLIVVQINPVEQDDEPRSHQEILDRMKEITFNASLLNELRNIEFVGRLVREARVDKTRYREFLVHRIDGGAALKDFDASTRLGADRRLFETLFERGRAVAQDWLADHFEAIGERSTLDLRKLIANPDGGV